MLERPSPRAHWGCLPAVVAVVLALWPPFAGPVSGQQAAQTPRWRLVTTAGDCPGHDVALTKEPNPDAARCTAAFDGFTAVCWTDGCTYKNVATAGCTGGIRPGRMYTCDAGTRVGPRAADDLYMLCRAAAVERGTGTCESIQDRDLRMFCLGAADRNRRSGGTCGSIVNPDLRRACEGASGPRSWGSCDNVLDPDWRELCRSWYTRYDGCSSITSPQLQAVCRTVTGIMWNPRGDACEAIPHATTPGAAKPTTFPAASQSSLDWGGQPERAIDGNTDGNWGANSVTHTAKELGAWWQVDLGRIVDIGQIVISNRTDCCSERLADFFVLTSEQPFSKADLATLAIQPGVWSYRHADPAGPTVTVPVGRRARFVRVQLVGENYLSLAEVQIR